MYLISPPFFYVSINTSIAVVIMLLIRPVVCLDLLFAAKVSVGYVLFRPTANNFSLSLWLLHLLFAAKVSVGYVLFRPTANNFSLSLWLLHLLFAAKVSVGYVLFRPTANNFTMSEQLPPYI
jgi:hypothetical protein